MPTLEEEKTLKDVVATKYRRIPRAAVITIWVDREKRCERASGHVLAFRKGKIVCTQCTAEWEDMGC